MGGGGEGRRLWKGLINTRFIHSRSSASIPHNPGVSFQTTVNGSYEWSKKCCVGFSSAAHLLSMLLVSMEKIGRIINRKFGGAVTVTTGSRECDLCQTGQR